MKVLAVNSTGDGIERVNFIHSDDHCHFKVVRVDGDRDPSDRKGHDEYLKHIFTERKLGVETYLEDHPNGTLKEYLESIDRTLIALDK